MPEKKLSEYGEGLSSEDNWSDAWMDALADFQSEGGRLLVDVTNYPQDPVDLRVDTNPAIEIVSYPDALTLVKPTNSATGVFSVAGYRLLWKGMNFVGRDVDQPEKLTADCSSVIGIASTDYAGFQDITFAGIINSQGAIRNYQGLKVELNNIRSGGGGGRIFHSENANHIIINGLRSIDNFQVFGQYRYFDRNSNADYWVYITATLQGHGERSNSVEINDFEGDEDGETHIYIENQQHVKGSMIFMNCINTGVHLNNVLNAQFNQVHAGYNDGSTKGMRVNNCPDVSVTGFNWDSLGGDPAHDKYIQIDDLATNFVGENVRGRVVAPQALFYRLNGRKYRGGVAV